MSSYKSIISKFKDRKKTTIKSTKSHFIIKSLWEICYEEFSIEIIFRNKFKVRPVNSKLEKVHFYLKNVM